MGVFDRITERPLLRRLLAPAGAFLGVLIAGVVGLSALAGVGLLEAAFWILDPTSIELHFEAHPDGPVKATKAYALVVFSGIVLTSVWAGETVLQAAFGGQIRSELSQVRMERDIERLDDHVIVCGFGMFGQTITERMLEAGRDVVVIEREQHNLEQAPDDAYTLVGDARMEETLQDAGVDRAGSLVAAIDDSNANIQITIVAGQLAPNCHVVVRVGDEIYEATARRAGADEVIIPEVTSGNEVSEIL